MINDLNRIKQLLKLYDEAKTTDEEEAELADFFHTATDIPEEWQDYAVLFSVLDSADTLFNNNGQGPSKSSLKEDFISSPFKGDKRGSFFYHLYLVLAFLSVIITYFGVNFFLGGMHSYANG